MWLKLMENYCKQSSPQSKIWTQSIHSFSYSFFLLEACKGSIPRTVMANL